MAQGARLATDGTACGGKGYFFEPTFLVHVSDTAKFMQEEPFSPIAVTNPVTSLNQAINMANAVLYGLAGYAFIHRTDYIDQLADELADGNLSVNTLEASMPETPFCGVNSSGYGREGVCEGQDSYMDIKHIWQSAQIV